MKKYRFILVLFTIITFSSCHVVDPMSGEQYEKNIYIIGAYNKVSSFNVLYGNEESAFVSISASGTKKVDKNIEVILKQNDDLIEWYNNKYMLDQPVKYQQLDPELIQVPSWSTILTAGEIYTRLPFTVNTKGLHCDSLYAISFEIESVSDYQIEELGKELIFTLKLSNEFSGFYHMDATKIMLREETLPDGSTEWVEQGLAVPTSTQRALTAVSENELRFFHDKTKETLAEYSNSWDPGKEYFDAIEKYCIVLKKGEDNKFTIDSWKDMKIIEGEAEYSVGMFSFWYDFTEGNNRYRMQGVFRK